MICKKYRFDQNYNEMSSHTSQNGYHQKIRKQMLDEEKVTLLHRWCKCKLVQPLWRTVWWSLKKLKIELPCDPATPPLGKYPEKSTIPKDTCTPMFIAALFTIARTRKQPRCPLTDEGVRKMWYIYTMEYYPAKKKNEFE